MDEEQLFVFEVETTYKSGRVRTNFITAPNGEEMWKIYDKHHNAKLIKSSAIVDETIQ